MVSRVWRTIRSSVPCSTAMRPAVSSLGIQVDSWIEYGTASLGCQVKEGAGSCGERLFWASARLPLPRCIIESAAAKWGLVRSDRVGREGFATGLYRVQDVRTYQAQGRRWRARNHFRATR